MGAGRKWGGGRGAISLSKMKWQGRCISLSLNKIDMMAVFKVQRAITQKVSKQFSFSADLFMVLHICVKFTSISQKLLFSMFKDP